jgi:hypothetical protein
MSDLVLWGVVTIEIMYLEKGLYNKQISVQYIYCILADGSAMGILDRWCCHRLMRMFLTYTYST